MALKFRAYDRKYKSMDDVVQLDWWNDDLRVNDDTFSDYVVMQSTGLHDKNGVDIFDGDIVKVLGEYGDDLSVVKFESGAFVLDYKNLDTEFELIYSVSLPIKVIGNIYTTPELLEDL